MSEWWTYRLSDFLLFSPRTYYRLFELYNAEIWPAQLAAIALGVAILLLLRRPTAWADRAIAAILAAGWLFAGWAFHYRHYATINWAASYFAAAFALQAALLAWSGVLRGRLKFGARHDAISMTGLCVFLFALFVQPLIGPLVGRSWAQAELFGLAPDPTALGTLGLILVADGRARSALLVVPILSSAVSGATLWTMNAPDAVIMPSLAALVLALAIWRGASVRAR